MNKCTESEIQEMLPDLLHRALAVDARDRVEAHVATCEQCREDLAVLRTVNGAAVFTPKIDVDRVVGRILPYQTIIPATERPARTRVVSWLVAATLAIVVAGGGSLLLMQPKSGARAVAVDAPVSGVHTYALALAADVDGLSDGSLVQLMDEMNHFDALPVSEPDPVISVDSATNVEQD
jgi:putative zinc finger protein